MLLLFESNSADDTAIDCHEIISSTRYAMIRKAARLRAFLHCGDQYGIIYENDTDLYRLDLTNIDDDIRFECIAVSDENQIWNYVSYGFAPKYLSMIYLPKTQSIFAIYNQYSLFSVIKIKPEDPEFIEQERKCGIFDLNDKKWKSVSSLRCRRKYKDQRKYYHFEPCLNEYDDNIIYAVSNTGNVQRYDIEKNEWSELVKDGLSLTAGRRHIVWMDNIDTICCGSNDGSFFGSCNIGENKPKWNAFVDFNQLYSDVSVMSIV